MAQEQGTENVGAGPTEYDAENRQALEKFVPPGLNLEHIVYGNTPSKEIGLRKAQLASIIQMGLLSAGTPTAEQRILAKSATFVGDGMIDRSKDGFERRAGITTREEQMVFDMTKKNRSLLDRAMHPFGQKPGVQPT